MCNRVERLVLAGLMLLALAGCASPAWERYAAPGAVESPRKSFSFQAPRDWRRAPEVLDDRIVLTRDGPGIQVLVFARRPLDRSFPVTKARPGPDTSPRELGELALAELRAEAKGAAIELRSLGETRVDGRPAYRLHLAERTESGVRYERLMVGVAGANGYVFASCRALGRHYFAQALPDCEAAIASLRLLSP